jgi:hypothetical protein
VPAAFALTALLIALWRRSRRRRMAAAAPEPAAAGPRTAAESRS